MALRVVAPAAGAPPTGWRRADPLPDGADHRGARARCWTRWRDGEPRASGRTGARGRGQRRRGARHGGRRAADPRRCCRSRRRSRSPTRSIPARSWRPTRQAAAATLREAVAARAFSRHPAGRRHRLRQDRGLPGSGRRMPAPGPPGAGAAAGDRAVLAMAGALRAPLRRGAGGVALRPDLAGPARSPGARWPTGAAPVVVGARSALFLPFPDLGLVVVDEEHETAFKQEEGVVYHARDMAVVRARFCAAPAVLVSATPSPGDAWPTSRPAATAASRLPTRHGGAVLPAVAAIDMRGDAAGARPLPRAAADRGGARHAGARRAGDAVPQPPRLRAADAVPALRPPHAVPELHRLAGGAPRPRARCNATIAATPCRSREECPACGAANSLVAGRAGRGAHHRGGRRAVPRRAPAGDGQRHDARPARRRRGGARDRGARGGPDHRHPDRRQGLALSASDAGGRGGRRSGPGRRRPARGRADGAVAAPGGRARRPRRGAGAGAAADVLARASGDAGAGGGRPGGVHGARGGAAAAGALAAVWPAGGADRSARTARRRPMRWRATWGGRRRTAMGWRCWGRRRRRWRCCAGGTGGGCC